MADPLAPKPPVTSQPDLEGMRSRFFQQRRNEAQNNVNTQAQGQNDAIQRRFASMGASGSGAQIAALQNAAQGQAQALRGATQDIDQGELQSNMASQEANLGRQFQAGESQLGRQLQSDEAQRGRDLQSKFFDIEQGNKLKQLDLAERNFGLEKDAQAFNTRMAEMEANRKPRGLFSSLKGIPGVSQSMDITKKFTDALGLGGDDDSGTLICTELHRQGILNDHMFKLDGLFGRDFAKNYEKTYQGYLLLARPVVRKMRTSETFTKIIARIFMPWCYWMAAKYDKKIKSTFQGAVIYYSLRMILPCLYFVNKTFSLEVKHGANI